MIYFDNAATTGKKPLSVIKATENALYRYSANPGRSGHKLSQDTALKVYEVREKTAIFFGADGAEQVVFTLNCTHSLNCVIKGKLKAGDHVIISDLEHNAVMRPLYKTGIEYSTAQVSLTDDDITVDNFKKLIKSNTKMIIATGASNVLGKALPISKLGMLCRENGIDFTVDAAQAAGIVPINMNKMNIDYLCVAAHKGLYAPMGLGILIARKPLENTLIEGGTGTNSVSFEQPEYPPERYESGTVNVPAICGLGAGIDYVNSKGLQNIFNHEMRIVSQLYEGMAKRDNILLYTPNPLNHNYVPVISFNVVSKTSDEISEYLNTMGIAVRAGLHCAPTAHKKIGTLDIGTVRVSPGTFNTQSEAEYFLKVLKKIL